MKTIINLACLVAFLFCSNSHVTAQVSKTEFIHATYDGLTENLEFQFTADNGKVYLFEEIDKDLDFDLYDEQNFGKRFKVSWTKKNIHILDDEDEPTGEIREIKVILDLKKP